MTQSCIKYSAVTKIIWRSSIFSKASLCGYIFVIKFKTFLKQQQPQAFQNLCNIFLIELMEDFPSLAVDLRNEPTTVLQTLGLAVSQVLYKHVLYYFYLHILQVISVYVKVGSRGE